MPETLFGYVEEFSTPEVLNTAFGAVVDGLGHMFLENFLDPYFKNRYPDNYFVYSTLTTTGIMGIAAFILYLTIGRKRGMEWMQYIAGGIIVGEVLQILDILRVTFGWRGE